MSSSGGSISVFVGSKWATIAAIAAVAAGGTVAATVTGGGGAALTFNLGVTTGTCDSTPTRVSSQVALADLPAGALACTVDQAWDAATAGDRIGVKAGTYGHQCVTGNKASDTKIVGDGDGSDVIFARDPDVECRFVLGGANAFGADGAHIWLENVTLDAGDEGSVGTAARIWSGATNVTFVDVRALGDFPAVGIEAANFTWRGGQLGDLGPANGQPEMTCTNSAWIPLDSFAANTTIDGIAIGPRNRQTTPTPNAGGCGADGLPHIELVRPWGGADNFTLKNVYFVPSSENGSATIFTSSTISGLKIINTFFGELGDNADNQYMLYMGSVTSGTFVSNTFEGNIFLDGGSYTFAGNLGWDAFCDTNVKNVWRDTGSCGTDTFLGSSADLRVDDSTGRLQAGSPAVDAGETPGASDYCTDPNFAASLDREGDARPAGSVCDAGADEYQG